MSGARPAWTAGSGVCKLLRDQLVEVISGVRSQAALVDGLALTGVGGSPGTGAEDARSTTGAPQPVRHDGSVNLGEEDEEL
jgi:hypothetical protein